MTKLTVEQRAQRRATRINNKLKKGYPLLASGGLIDPWMVVPEEMVEIIKKEDANEQAYIKRLEGFKKELEEEAQVTRSKVAEVVTPETLEKLDDERKIYPPGEEYSASFWNTALSRINGDQRGYFGEEAEELLKWIGLSEKRDEYPSRLSGGQQQRVAIARALCMEPKIMLFDEPTSALDPELIGEVVEVMERLANQGMTMIVVTHEIHFARDVADRVILMADGVWAEVAPPSELFTNPKEERTRQFLAHIL